MIDAHAHVMYNLDDGSKSYEMSLNMIRKSVDQGVRALGATTHYIEGLYQPDLSFYEDRLMALREQFEGEIELVSSMEIMISKKIPRFLDKKLVLGYNGSRNLLIEFKKREIPSYSYPLFKELAVSGYSVLLAHPERNQVIQENRDILLGMSEIGVKFQLNAGSLIGHYGNSAQGCAEYLVENGLVFCLGSDGHNDFTRDTSIRYAYEIIREKTPLLFEKIILQGNDFVRGIIKDI